MRRILLSIVSLFAMVAYSTAETYTHSFAKNELGKTAETVTLSAADWITTDVAYVGWDSNDTAKGIQIGSSSKPATSYSLSTSTFAYHTITKVTVNSSKANNGDATMVIKVGDSSSEEFTLTTTATDYSFDCNTAGDIVISWTCSAKAYYVKSVTIEYVISEDAIATPSFSLAAGNHEGLQSVELSCSTEGAKIHYTIDGSDPTTSPLLYEQAIALNYGETTIKAIAISADGTKKSDIVSATYNVMVEAPEFITAPGVYADNVTVDVETANQSAVLYYTLDGSTPDYTDTTGSTLTTRYYVAYPKLTATTTIKAVAVLKDGDNVYFSDVVEGEFVISSTKPYAPATEIVSGSKYAMVNFVLDTDTVAAQPLAESYNYGYLNTSQVLQEYDTYLETIEYSAFTFTATDGGYTIQDTYGRYLYMSGSYNSFNVSATLPESGAVWSVTFNEDGTASITNVEKEKTIHYSVKYSSYGSYAPEKVTENDFLPSLFELKEYPEYTITPAVGTALDSFQKITITCEQGITAESWLNAYVEYFGNQVALTANQVDEKTVELATDAPITGNYTLWVVIYGLTLDPQGMAIPLDFATSDNLKYDVIQDVEAATITDITPANAASVETLSYVLFTFSDYIMSPSDDEAKQPKLYKEGSTDCIAVEGTSKTEDGKGYVGMMQSALKVVEPVTESGVYILEVPTGYFLDSHGKDITGVTLRYTVTGASVDTGIDSVGDDAQDKVIYDITGRRVNAVTAPGIYIINGKKTVIK